MESAIEYVHFRRWLSLISEISESVVSKRERFASLDDIGFMPLRIGRQCQVLSPHSTMATGLSSAMAKRECC